jgi:four helix bundle protein
MEKPHKKLNAWKSAMDLVMEVYRLTESFPPMENFTLTSQIRRAAVSVPGNIAEGAARQTRKEFINFLHVAQGSLSELDTQLELGRRLGYITQDGLEALDHLVERIDKMITGLIRHQREKRQNKRASIRQGLRIVDHHLTPHS